MSEQLVSAEAASKLAEVENLVAKLAAAEQQLESGYAALGALLEQVGSHEYWRGSYDSMGAFVTHISETYNIGRAQLYNYRSTAVALLDAGVTETEMNKMGINKAKELARVAKKNDGRVPAKAIDVALKPQATVKDVRRILFEALNIAPDENTDWMDLNFEFYVTEEERETLQDAANAARYGDPVISEKLEPSAQAKLIALKWAQNYLATFSSDVVDGGKNL